jgi:apolipoprotein N-acyltransferase
MKRRNAVYPINIQTLAPWILAFASGLLFSFSYALHPFWWAAWIAPAPAIAAVHLVASSQRRWLAWAIGLIGGFSTLTYRLTVTDWVATIAILVLMALAWSHAIRLAVTVGERWSASASMLVIPTIWATIDTLLIHFSPHGSAGSIAYSQMDALPVIQMASLGGVPLVTFVVLLGGSVLGLWITRILGAKVCGLSLATVLASSVIGGALLFGPTRFSSAQDAERLSVTMLATDSLKTQPTDWSSLWAKYGGAIEEAAEPGSLVVLPEAVVRLNERHAEQVRATLAKYALTRRSTIVVGIVVDENSQATNRTVIAGPKGQSAWYIKQHLVPGFESDMTPGDRAFVASFPVQGVGLAICKDMHFPTVGRELAQLGARLIVVTANDFEVDDWMTARMTVMRGVESGSSVVRSARHGISFASDRFGRVVAERRSDLSVGKLVSSVPLGAHKPTVYARIGDLFGWLCLVGWVGFLANGRRRAVIREVF